MFRQRFLSSSQVSDWHGRQIITIPSKTIVSAYANAVIADTPLRYWRFDEASGNFQTTYGPSTATIIGTPTRSTDHATVDGVRSIGFPTISDYVQLDSIGSLPGVAYRSSFSVECWFKVGTLPDISAPSHTYLLAGTDNSAMGFSSMSWYLGLYRTVATGGIGRVYFTASNSGASSGVDTTPNRYDNSLWHHAVGTYNGSSVRLYLNGSLIGSAGLSGNVGAGSYAPRIGVLPDVGGGYPSNTFPGFIDEVAIYPTALSAARILAHYQAAI